MRAYLDTNVIVRFLTGEPSEPAEAARGLFASAARGEVELFVPTVIVIETGFVLLRVFGVERGEAATLLASLLECPGLVFEQRDVLWRMVEVLREHSVPLVDAYLAAFVAVRGGGSGSAEAPVVVSFDRHFDGLPGVRRVASVRHLAS
ncbi:MAG: PIN domain-containing protein [Actinobacteria bacterium]|nr:PIN domain-containing protein [Actinomycetota bacterium]